MIAKILLLVPVEWANHKLNLLLLLLQTWKKQSMTSFWTLQPLKNYASLFLNLACLGTGIIKGPFTFDKTIPRWRRNEYGEREYTPYSQS